MYLRSVCMTGASIQTLYHDGMSIIGAVNKYQNQPPLSPNSRFIYDKERSYIIIQDISKNNPESKSVRRDAEEISRQSWCYAEGKKYFIIFGRIAIAPVKFLDLLGCVSRAQKIEIRPSSVRRPSVASIISEVLHGFLSNFSGGFPWAICPENFFGFFFMNIFRFR